MTRATLPGGLRIIGALTTPRAMEVVMDFALSTAGNFKAVFADTKVFSAVLWAWGSIIERFQRTLHLPNLLSEIIASHYEAIITWQMAGIDTDWSLFPRRWLVNVPPAAQCPIWCNSVTGYRRSCMSIHAASVDGSLA